MNTYDYHYCTIHKIALFDEDIPFHLKFNCILSPKNVKISKRKKKLAYLPPGMVDILKDDYSKKIPKKQPKVKNFPPEGTIILGSGGTI